MPNLVVFGATGFVGSAVLAEHRSTTLSPVGVSRMPHAQTAGDARWVTADLMDPDSLRNVLAPGDVVVNLAYLPHGSAAVNEKLACHLVNACRAARVARLVHVSTANVVGIAPDVRVTERTTCVPKTDYERGKLSVEQIVLGASSEVLDVAILRPTAVIGTGGKNLASLAASLRRRRPAVDYLRRALYGRRPMHLVPVEDVARAVLHVAEMPGRHERAVFYVSADDDPDNTFDAVEDALRDGLGLRPRRAYVIPIPSALLSALLRLRGRTEYHLRRRYASDALRSAGWRPRESVRDAVRLFGHGLR